MSFPLYLVVPSWEKKSPELTNEGRIHLVDALRGVAAVLVALFHFTHGNPRFLSVGLLHSAGAYGWAGVDIFFVISGFIIPMSLHRSGYSVRNFFTFVWRRIVRLDPPYLVSIVVVIMLAYASSMAPGFQGERFVLSLPRLFLHIGYLNGFFGVPWYSDIYWTLAIELQFYLLMGLIYPLLVDRRDEIGTSVLALLALSGFAMSSPAYLTAWIFPFLMGITAFRFRSGLVSLPVFLVQVLAASAGTRATLGPLPFFETMISTGAIAFVTMPPIRVVAFFGAISYPLYLLHITIGGRVINIAARLQLTPAGKLGAVFAAFALSTAAAYVLHQQVEVPAQRWSRRFTWKSPPGARDTTHV